MSQHQQWIKDQETRDQELHRLVIAMNAAKGQARIDAVADVVNELVTRRLGVDEERAALHGRMMAHMAQHASAGGGAMNCPALKSMQEHAPGHGQKPGARD